MEFSRIKNILIVILLILNALLAVNISTTHDFGSSMSKEERKNITALFEKDGVTLQPECLKGKSDYLPMLQIVVSDSAADTFMHTIDTELQSVSLGKVQGVENKNLRVFHTDDLTYRIEIFDADAAKINTILKNAGITLNAEKTIMNPQIIDGYPVLNAMSRLQKTDTELTIETRWILETKELPSPKAALSPFSLLVSFALLNREENLGVTSIKSYTFQYYIAESSLGGYVLTPTMQLHCDNGDFLLDAVTGMRIGET